MNAVNLGAESIIDLSSFGDTQTFRKKLIKEFPVMIGTVPIYDTVVYYNKLLISITSKEWIDVVRIHAEDGVNFITFIVVLINILQKYLKSLIDLQI